LFGTNNNRHAHFVCRVFVRLVYVCVWPKNLAYKSLLISAARKQTKGSSTRAASNLLLREIAVILI